MPNARSSGRTIGTPGVLHMLDTAHRDGGRLTWKERFDPAIKIATEGFRISPRMSASIAGDQASGRLRHLPNGVGVRHAAPSCRRRKTARRRLPWSTVTAHDAWRLLAEQPADGLFCSAHGQQLCPDCQARGRRQTAAQSRSIGTIVRRSNPQGCYCLEGGADPRREGIVLGNLYRSE